MDKNIFKPDWFSIIQNIYANAIWVGICSLVAFILSTFKLLVSFISIIHFWIQKMEIVNNLIIFFELFVYAVGLYLLCAIFLILIPWVLKRLLSVISKSRNQHKPISVLEVKELSFLEKQKKAIKNITKLINAAVDNILIYSDGIQYPGEISINEQRKQAFDSGENLMNYFKEENNRSYFPKTTRNKIKCLYESISICLQRASAATVNDFNSSLWNECCEKMKKTDEIRDDIFSDFREILDKNVNLKIEISPSVKLNIDNRVPHISRLEINNLMEKEISECYATLASLVEIYWREGERKYEIIPGIFYEPDRIKWDKSSNSDKKCRATIPGKGSGILNVAYADIRKRLQLNLCGSILAPVWQGIDILCVVEVKVYGRLDNNLRNLGIFHGYIYSKTISAGSFDGGKTKVPMQNLLFKKGDWTKDARVSIKPEV